MKINLQLDSEWAPRGWGTELWYQLTITRKYVHAIFVHVLKVEKAR